MEYLYIMEKSINCRRNNMKRFLVSFVAVVFTFFGLTPATIHAHPTASTLQYKVTGEVRAFEATYHYRVKNKSKTLVQGYGQASKGAPEWGKFSKKITIKKKDSKNKLTLELYEPSMADGSELNKLVIDLKKIKGKEFKNNGFRHVKVQLLK